jgi:transglutaminase-like putative cysteine protease
LRFVSGYLNTRPSSANYGATHAWAEVFLPGAGWKGFDPTTGLVVGTDHIAVAVAAGAMCSPSCCEKRPN